ncbi:hypothetical protein RF55_7618 [Lasius niger]|uniref:Uncharacterized protein n=1 Tax=Lasius niger TaxID=67767 RepID=A0A0J7KPW6_LASNI|nr:hypothetical protein RF55_7618 [Lasius niger]
MSKDLLPTDMIADDDDEPDAERVEATYGSQSPSYHPDDPAPPQTRAAALPLEARYSFRTEKRPTDKHLPELGSKKRKGNPTTRQMDVLQSIMEALERIEANNAAAQAQQTTLLERLIEAENNNAARLERLMALSQDCQTRLGVAETRIRTLQEARRDEATQVVVAAGTSTQTHPTTPHIKQPRTQSTLKRNQ